MNCNTTHESTDVNVGLTKKRLRDRVAEHRCSSKTGNLNYPVAKHHMEAQIDEWMQLSVLMSWKSHKYAQFVLLIAFLILSYYTGAF